MIILRNKKKKLKKYCTVQQNAILLSYDKITVKLYLILFDESDERGAFDFDRLLRPVVQGDHEMKEIRFPQVAGRLLFKMCPSHADAVKNKNEIIQLSNNNYSKNREKLRDNIAYFTTIQTVFDVTPAAVLNRTQIHIFTPRNQWKPVCANLTVIT